MEDIVVSGVAFNRNEAKISILGVPDTPGIAADLFGTLADANIVVDMIIQNVAADNMNDISFTVGKEDFDEAVLVAKDKKNRKADHYATINLNSTNGREAAKTIEFRMFQGTLEPLFFHKNLEFVYCNQTYQ